MKWIKTDKKLPKKDRYLMVKAHSDCPICGFDGCRTMQAYYNSDLKKFQMLNEWSCPLKVFEWLDVLAQK